MGKYNYNVQMCRFWMCRCFKHLKFIKFRGLAEFPEFGQIFKYFLFLFKNPMKKDVNNKKNIVDLLEQLEGPDIDSTLDLKDLYYRAKFNELEGIKVRFKDIKTQHGHTHSKVRAYIEKKLKQLRAKDK